MSQEIIDLQDALEILRMARIKSNPHSLDDCGWSKLFHAAVHLESQIAGYFASDSDDVAVPMEVA